MTTPRAALPIVLVALLAAGCGSDPAGELDSAFDCAPVGLQASPPPVLSEAGLYADFAAEAVCATTQSFEPAYELWSDGAVKQRWVSLPEGATIDTSDMDHWSMPVGTRLFKDFRYDGALVETRVSHRFGAGTDDWWFATYAWRTDGSDADHAPEGVENADGAGHDIPAELACKSCHFKLEERALGFSAIQLSHDRGETTLDSLVEQRRLSDVPEQDLRVPGDRVESAALGYLHANCGHCHNDTGVAFPDEPYRLRVLVGETTVADTGAFTTAVGKPVVGYMPPPSWISQRIAPGDAEASYVVHRMGQRHDPVQMPPFATNEVHDEGLATVRAWIDAMRP